MPCTHGRAVVSGHHRADQDEYLYIAVVDDDENFYRSLGRLLRAAADAKHPLFDCLVLDVHLGEISGIDLGQQLVAEGRDSPFICITAHDDPETRALAEAAGCAAFFQKSDSGAAVLDAIRRVAL